MTNKIGDIFLQAEKNYDGTYKYLNLCQITGIAFPGKKIERFEYQFWSSSYEDYIVSFATLEEVESGKNLLQEFMNET